MIVVDPLRPRWTQLLFDATESALPFVARLRAAPTLAGERLRDELAVRPRAGPYARAQERDAGFSDGDPVVRAVQDQVVPVVRDTNSIGSYVRQTGGFGEVLGGAV